MLKIIINKNTYEFPDYVSAIKFLKNKCYSNSDDIGEYMSYVSRRYRIKTGSRIRFNNPESFINELDRVKEIKIVEK